MQHAKRLKLLIRIVLYLALINSIFFVIYRHFIIGNGIYLYYDIGSDSYTSSYPIISMLARLFQRQQFPVYELTAGLGSNIAVTYLQYLNPLKTFLLCFSREMMPFGLLLYLWLQTNVTAVAGYFFFRLLLKHDLAAFVPAILWTFTGYTVLWSQNLSFGVCITMFTLTMLALEAMLQRTTFRSVLTLTGVLAFFLVTNYYFFYMTGVFTIAYVIAAGLLRSQSVKTIAYQLLLLAASAAGALLLSCAAVMAILSVFGGSSRTSEITQSVSLFGLITKGELVTMLGRLFSSNFWGTGELYSAEANYYESSILTTSALCLTAVMDLLLQKKHRIRTIILLLLTGIVSVSPVAAQLLTFNPGSARHRFLIVFTMVIAIGFFTKSFFLEPSGKRLLTASLSGLVLTLILLATVRRLGTSLGYSINRRSVLFFVLFLVTYTLFLPACGWLSQRIHFLPPVLILIITAEMVITNYDTVNFRDYFTDGLYEYAFFNDGTQQAADRIRTRDTDLYRTSVGTDVTRWNAGMVCDLNGTSGYSNTMPGSLSELSVLQDTYQSSVNSFDSDYAQYLQYTLLGGRYMIRDGFDYLSDGMEPSLMEELDRIQDPEHGIDKRIFQNNYALPFGYLYHSEADPAAFDALSGNEKLHLLTSAFVETDGSATNLYQTAEPLHTDKRESLMQHLTEANDVEAVCNGDTVALQAAHDAATMYFSFDAALGEQTLQSVHFKLQPTNGQTRAHFVLYPLTKKEPLAREEYSKQIELNLTYPEADILLPDETIGLRLDVKDPSVTLADFSLLTCDGVEDALTALADTPIEKIQFENSTYTAEVNAADGGMLCVPLIYSPEWNAEVNGTPVETHNINGGLVGIPLENGTSKITIRYVIPHFTIGCVISGIAWILYLGLWIVSGPVTRKRRQRIRTK